MQLSYRSRPERRRLINEHVDKMLASEVIEAFLSECASPGDLKRRKKHGTPRLFIDYCILNKITIHVAYPFHVWMNAYIASELGLYTERLT